MFKSKKYVVRKNGLYLRQGLGSTRFVCDMQGASAFSLKDALNFIIDEPNLYTIHEVTTKHGVPQGFCDLKD